MVSEMVRKNREYMRVRDPHFGEKINCEDDLLFRVIDLLETHPEGLAIRALTSMLIPYEGQYHIPFPNHLGRLVSTVRGTYKQGDKWKYTPDDSHHVNKVEGVA